MLKGMGWRPDATFECIDEIADGTGGKCLDESRTFQVEIEANVKGDKTYYNVGKIKTGVAGRMDRKAVKERLSGEKPANPDDFPF